MSRIRQLLCLVVVFSALAPEPAMAVSPTAQELAEAWDWTVARFETTPEGEAQQATFSFTYDGKPCGEWLAACQLTQDSRMIDENRTERTLRWTHSTDGLEVRCVSVGYRDFPVVEWTTYLRNTGTTDTPIIENVQALDNRWERAGDGEFTLRGIKGDIFAADSYAPYEIVFGPNAAQRFAPIGGRPTNGAFPYFNLVMPGGGVILAVGWPGQWATSFTRDGDKAIQVVAGQELTHLRLKPGEEIRTPLMALLFWKGPDPIRAQNLWRRWMLAHNVPRRNGEPMPPILIMCTTDFYPGLKSVAAEEIEFAKAYLDAGVKLDYWVIDAGWYPCGDGWWTVGTWELDPERYPSGVREVSDYIHSRGVGMSLWFEPERVTYGTWLATTHPEWLFDGANTGRDHTLLNLGNSEARQWVTDHIDRMLTEQGIDLYRQDFNTDPLPYWQNGDAAQSPSDERQGISENLHVQGYLAFWDELLRRDPARAIDCCAGGGRRNDLETLRRGLPLLRSDYLAEPKYTQQCQTYGLAQWIPYFGSGAPDRDDYTSRSVWCPRYAIARAEPRQEGADWTEYLRMAAEWRSASDYLLGDFYPLAPYSLEDTVWMAWQFNCPERGEGMVQAFRRAQSIYESIRPKLQGLAPDAVYTLTNLDVPGTTEVTGRELMENGISIVMQEPPQSTVIVYRRN